MILGVVCTIACCCDDINGRRENQERERERERERQHRGEGTPREVERDTIIMPVSDRKAGKPTEVDALSVILSEGVWPALSTFALSVADCSLTSHLMRFWLFILT